jgi:hypothetical protein
VSGECAPPLPGTIKFNQNPNKEGEVTSGTAAKLKINGKEAAVVGSKVTTCNDNGAKDNSTILGSGTSMPMPAIVNPKNAPEGDKEEKHPEFTQVKWSKTTVKEVQTDEDGHIMKDDCLPDEYVISFVNMEGTHRLVCTKINIIVLSDTELPVSQ